VNKWSFIIDEINVGGWHLKSARHLKSAHGSRRRHEALWTVSVVIVAFFRDNLTLMELRI